MCSVEIIAGVLLLSFGAVFGGVAWYQNGLAHIPTPTGTIMLSVLPIIIGVQLLLEAVTLDLLNMPETPLQEEWNWSWRP